jgi:putative nucleotidyltransferase with HDIG domain
VKSFPTITLVVVGFLACYGEDIYLSVRQPHVGEILYLTVRSQRPFHFDQEKALGSKRQAALAQYTPMYSYMPDKVDLSKKRMQDLIRRVSSLSSYKKGSEAEFEKYLQKEFGEQVGTVETAKLLQYSGLRNLLEAILAIEDSILQNRIVEDQEPLKGKKTIEVLFSSAPGPLAYPVSEVVSLEEARDILRKRISKVFWQVDESILGPVIQIALAIVTPNLKYNQKENDRRIEQIIQRYPSQTVLFKAGEILVPFRKVLTEEDVLLLSAHLEMEKKVAYGNAPWILFAILFSVVTYNLLLTKVLQPWYRNGAPVLLHLSVLILAVFILKLVLLFTSFPIYALPVAFVPMLLILLYPEKLTVTLTTMLGAFLVTLFTGRTLQILLFFGFGGIAAIIALPLVRKRYQVLVPSLVVGCINAAAALLFVLDINTIAASGGELSASGARLVSDIMGVGFFPQMGWAFVGGFVSGPLALVLLPFFEKIWNTASTFQLLKYADLDSSLMKELLTTAPGTYQHTMTVAHFAQVASEAIGANTLLARVGAYYHDIGKTIGPKYFVENQFGGLNPHSDLPPEQSAGIIIDHVKNGLRLGKEARLPQAILDFIPQHHGTLLVEYFYDKARKSSENGQAEEARFRYSGLKPQSMETAILMITDAVEAASRSLHEPIREKIDTMVRKILQTRIADGQFDECNLSTRDIARIRDALIDSLAASFHRRLQYPWQEAEEQVPSDRTLSSG